MPDGHGANDVCLLLGSAMVSPTEMMRQYNSVDGTRKIAWIKIVVYTTMTRTMDLSAS